MDRIKYNKKGKWKETKNEKRNELKSINSNLTFNYKSKTFKINKTEKKQNAEQIQEN